jgi:hypothetical protein
MGFLFTTLHKPAGASLFISMAAMRLLPLSDQIQIPDPVEFS